MPIPQFVLHRPADVGHRKTAEAATLAGLEGLDRPQQAKAAHLAEILEGQVHEAAHATGNRIDERQVVAHQRITLAAPQGGIAMVGQLGEGEPVALVAGRTFAAPRPLRCWGVGLGSSRIHRTGAYLAGTVSLAADFVIGELHHLLQIPGIA